jgi:simple sugar transport system substrate-binding protein
MMRLGSAALLGLVAAACGTAEGDPREAEFPEVRAREDLRFVLVTHGSAADPFWSVVANGARNAAADLGVSAEYQAPTTFDMVAMSQLLDAAIASRPDGLVVSLPDPDALGPSLARAASANIPVVSINSGDDAYARLGALVHVGQPERDAGFQAGERLLAAGFSRVLCVNHEVGNSALDMRCTGLAAALAAAGGASTVLAVDLADPEDTRRRISSALAADPTIDAVLTLGTTGAEPALQALAEVGPGRRIALATFDLSPRVLEAIAEGEILFAVDQQPYLQGYLPIVLLTAYLETRTVPGGGRPVPTGPAFVTGERAREVIELSRRGVR